ncbi:hypothetical protein BST83_13380 [Polaribacter filamentus]|uniref:Uncharacterized protein n=1 Tax=Polaribacter filamentus TaxID=53483 RepID=A0A2S7KZV5_9FLAO|nr:hypothetical protein [Polaribacter filamentus]PQB08033.1 hypothetical protein BST83_13380 [Polaribacter filamentus]
MIKILTKNGIELPYLKETLSLKDVNDAFNDSLTLTHAEFPFIIEENEDVIKELGSSEINSLTSKKEIEITFIFGASVFFGKLKVLKYLKNRRSCVLKFGNEFIKILDKKIADYMPVYKYNGETPYTETVAAYYDQSTFIEAIKTDIAKPYPQIDYAAPTLDVGKYYTDDEWSSFQQRFNQKLPTLLVNRRETIIADFSYNVKNFNSFVPMPYLMALLKNPILNNGYKLAGSFVDNPFNSKIVIVPKETHNNTAYLENTGIYFSFADAEILTIGEFYSYVSVYANFGIGIHNINIALTNIQQPTTSGTTKVKVYRIYNEASQTEFFLEKEITEFDFVSNAQFIESISFEVTEDNITDSALCIQYQHSNNVLPDESTININPEAEETVLHLIHPTVDLSRYVPDWSIGELINNLKNWQNLDIVLDEVTKTIYLNYNIEFLNSTDHVDLSDKVIAISDKENAFKNKYNLTYADNKNNVLIEDGHQTINGVVTEDVVSITNKFKALTENSIGNPTSKEYLAEAGVTLILLSDTNEFANSYNTQTLGMHGDFGIVNNYWKKWINFRQKAKQITAVAYLNTLEISKIKKIRKIYFDTRMFAVKGFTTKIKTKLNEVTFELENIIPSKGSTITAPVVTPAINITGYAIAENNGFWVLPWKIVVNFNYVDFSAYNGTITAKQLTGAIGSSYSGLEYTNAVNTINGSSIFQFGYDMTGLAGIYEISLVDNGITSNIIYVDVAAEVAPISEKIIITEVAQPGVFFYSKIIFTLAFENFTPAAAEIHLQKVDISTQLNIGLPIITAISDFTPANFEVDYPSSGSWKVTVKADGFVSNELTKLVMLI